MAQSEQWNYLHKRILHQNLLGKLLNKKQSLDSGLASIRTNTLPVRQTFYPWYRLLNRQFCLQIGYKFRKILDLLKHCDRLQQYNFKVKYLPETDNVVSDMLRKSSDLDDI